MALAQHARRCGPGGGAARHRRGVVARRESDDALLLDVAKALLVALVAGSLVLALAWHLYELADDTTWLLSRWVPMIRATLSYAVLGMFLGVTGVAGWRLRRAVDAD